MPSAAEAVLVDQYASIAWKLRRLGAAEQSVAADRFGKDLGKWLEDLDHTRWCKKHHPKLLEEGEDQPDPAPSNMAVCELLSEELNKGKGPLLRLMELEMRLRATLSNTLKQLKDLRALHKARVQDDAEADAECETEAPVEWDNDEDRWRDAADGLPRRRAVERPAKRRAEEAPQTSDIQTEPTAAPAPSDPTDEPQVAPEPEVAPEAQPA